LERLVERQGVGEIELGLYVQRKPFPGLGGGSVQQLGGALNCCDVELPVFHVDEGIPIDAPPLHHHVNLDA